MKISKLFLFVLVLIAVLTTFVSASTYSDLRNGLVSYWNFQDLKDDKILNNFTANDTAQITATDCKLGKCLDLDGTNDFVYNPSASFNLSTGDFTVNYWHKYDVAADSAAEFFQGSNANFQEIILGVNSNTQKKPYFLGSLTGASWGLNVAPPTSDVKPVWQMYTFTRKGSIYNISVNGSLKISSSVVGTIKVAKKYIALGRNYDPYAFINGRYDELAIWNRALNQANITALFNSGNAFNLTNNTVASLNYTIKAISKYNNSFINSFSIRLQNKTTNKYYYTNSGTISKILSTDKQRYNITFFNVTNHYNRTYVNYNFSNSSNLIGNLTFYSSVPYTLKAYSNTSIILDSSSYSDLIVGTFTNTANLKFYSSSLIQVYSLTQGLYQCRNLINNLDYGSETLFNLSTDSLNSFNILSNITNLSSSLYTYRVQCRKYNTLQPDVLVSQVDSFILFSNRTAKYNFSATSNGTFWRNVYNITYAMTPSIGSPLARNLIIDGTIPQNSYLRIVYNNTNITYHKNKYNQNLIYLLKENIAASSVTLKIYINSSTVQNYRFLLTENIDFNNRSVSKLISASTLLNTAYYKNITSINISIAKVNTNLLLKGTATVYSPVADDVGFKIKYGSSVKYFLKSIQAGESTVFDFMDIYENLSIGSNKIFYLQAYSSLQQSIIRNLSFSSLVTDRVSLLHSHFNVTLYKNYSAVPVKIQNFSIWYSGNEYTTTSSFIEIFATENQLVNLTIGSDQNGGYYNRSIIGFNTSFDLISNLYQSITTINLRHAMTNETILQRVATNVTTYGKKYNVTTGTITLYLPAGVSNIRYKGANYTLKVENRTVVARTTTSSYVYLNPILNITIYDEKTGLPFNMSRPSQVVMTVYCADGSALEQTLVSNHPSVSLSCIYTKIKFNVFFIPPTVTVADDYYRVLPYTPAFISATNFNFRVWLLDLSTTDVVINTFKEDDLFNEYENVQFLIYKIIGTTRYLITGDEVDAGAKVVTYLIKNNEYIIKVLSSNQPEKDMGSYYTDVSRESVIRLYDLSLSATVSDYNAQVSTYTYLMNDSGDLKVKAAVNDSGNNIVSSTFVVRQNDKNGAVICSLSSLTANVQYSCDVPDSIASVFYSALSVQTTNLSVVRVQEKTMKGSELVPFPVTFRNEHTKDWIFFSLLLIIGFTLSITTSSVGALIIVALAGFLKLIGWINLANVSTDAATNVKIAALVFGLLLFLVIAHLLKKGERGQP